MEDVISPESREVAAKERPILFSGPMVRAILAGRKTETRRPVTQQNSDRGVAYPWRDFAFEGAFADGRYLTPEMYLHVPVHNEEYEAHGSGPIIRIYPRHQIGDRLCVREAWRVTNWSGDDPEIKVRYEADGDSRWVEIPEEADPYGDVHTRLWLQSQEDMETAGYWWDPNGDEETRAVWRGDGPEPLVLPTRLRPSIHMYRWASRIQLEITDVRVERLLEISEHDAIAEGLSRTSKDNGQTWKYGIPDRDGLPGTDDAGWPWSEWSRDPGEAFFKLWDSINGGRTGCSRDANPFVWVVEFRRSS